MKKSIVQGIAIVLFLVLCFFLFLLLNEKERTLSFLSNQDELFLVKQKETITPYIAIGLNSIRITIADTETERSLGLSGTSSLPKRHGKWFVFNTPGKYGFWMKDMNYPIDIVWVRDDMIVSSVEENVLPESFPEVVYPKENIRFVLEINAFEARELGITTGTLLTLKK